MRALLIFATLLIAHTAGAQASYSETFFSENERSLYFDAGFVGGGLQVGADYEAHFHRTFGIGGFARYQAKDEEKAYGQTGVFALGAFIRPHFHRRTWDLYISPGFAMLMIDGAEDETALGPTLALGLMYQINNNMALGVEELRMYPWLADDYRGRVFNSLAVNFRMGL